MLSLAATLVRDEEAATGARDAHDRFLWAHRRAGQPGTSPRPVVSEYALRLLAAAEEAARRDGAPLIRKEFWPGGRPVAACLTHDVDAVRRGKLPRGIALRDATATLADLVRGRPRRALGRVVAVGRAALTGQNPYWTFDRISALERAHGYRSTYFAMAGRHHATDAAYSLAEPRVARLLRDLAQSGCEIALHGSYASSTDPSLLGTLKDRLEGHLGAPVLGHRNHFLRFRVPESWRAQQSAGLFYDTTLGFADHEGFRAGHAFPFHPFDPTAGRAMDLLEIPLAVMDVTLFKYRKLRGEAAWEAVLAVLEQTLAVHGLATLLWHNDTFFDLDYPGSARLYERALAWLAEHDAWVATCAEVDRWWRAREAAILTPLPPRPPVDGGSNASPPVAGGGRVSPPVAGGGRVSPPVHGGPGGVSPGWRLECPREINGLVVRVWLPDPDASPRVHGEGLAAVRRDGPDHLLEFGPLPAGAEVEIRWA